MYISSEQWEPRKWKEIIWVLERMAEAGNVFRESFEQLLRDVA